MIAPTSRGRPGFDVVRDAEGACRARILLVKQRLNL